MIIVHKLYKPNHYPTFQQGSASEGKLLVTKKSKPSDKVTLSHLEKLQTSTTTAAGEEVTNVPVADVERAKNRLSSLEDRILSLVDYKTADQLMALQVS